MCVVCWRNEKALAAAEMAALAFFTTVQKPRDEAFWATLKNGLWCLFLSVFSRQIGLCSA
jgi:hypothetical protein